MLLALLVFTAATAAPAPPADPPPGPPVEEAAACPVGDAPQGVLGALVHTSRARALDVSDGVGVLTITDTFENQGGGPAAFEWALSGPRGFGVVRAATIEEPGLPSRAARLDDADRAAEAFASFRDALMTGVEPARAVNDAERAALLVRHERDSAVVEVLAACSVRTLTVQIEVIVPSLPDDGAWRFALPGAPDEPVRDALVVDSADPVRVHVEGDVIRPGSRTSAPRLAEDDEDGALTVVVRPLAGPKLRARGYALRVDATPAAPAADGAADEDASAVAEAGLEPMGPVVVARAELDLPRPLADAPAGLRLVFVVDASVSVGERGLAKSLQMLDALLDAAPPDARYAVIAATRTPRVVVAPWRARDDRALPPVALGNGSDVLAALAKARAIAADVDAGEVPRIIALSDMRLRFVDDDARVARGFGERGAPLAHMIVVDQGDVELPFLWQRAFVDDDPRAAGPEGTGGIWIDAGDEDEAALFPHLIAPTRVDRPRVALGGADVLEGATAQVVRLGLPDDDALALADRAGPAALPPFLRAGSGLRVSVALPAAHAGFARRTRDLRVGGLLWATPLDERVRDDASLLGLAAVDAIGAALDDDLVRTIARRAGVVSRVTSLVDVPAFRPATAELGGLMGIGCSCGCCGCGSGLGGIGRSIGCRGPGPDLREREVLEALLAEDARACLVPRAVLDVEFGDEEILAVTEREGGPCVVERFWRHRLDLVEKVSGAFARHQEMTLGADLHAP